MPGAVFYVVEAGFEQGMGITLQRSRFVMPRDTENAPIVIDIDDIFARDVLRLVLGEGARMPILGVIAGIGGAFGLTRFMVS